MAFKIAWLHGLTSSGRRQEVVGRAVITPLVHFVSRSMWAAITTFERVSVPKRRQTAGKKGNVLPTGRRLRPESAHCKRLGAERPGMSQAPFFTTARKRPFLRGTEMSLSKWVSREVNIRKDAIIDTKDSSAANDVTNRDKAWAEIQALASLRFGGNVNVQELKTLWAKEGAEGSVSPGSNHSANSPGTVEQARQSCEPDIKLEISEEVDDDPAKKKKPSPTDLTARNTFPAAVYKIIVREVLRHSALLIDKNNSKSRTPQANQARWTAWQKIRETVQDETSRILPVEQIQIIWRHQKQKVPAELIEDAINSPETVDDKAIEKLFKHYEEREKLVLRQDVELSQVLKGMMTEEKSTVKNNNEVHTITGSLPATGQLPIQAAPIPGTNAFLVVSQNHIPVISAPLQNIQAPLLIQEQTMTSIDESINTVVRSAAAAEDRKHALVSRLVNAQIRFMEETADLQRKQLEVLNNFSNAVQKLLEK